MDALLLLVECVAIILVLRWVTSGDGAGGLIAWKEAGGKGETPVAASGPTAAGPAVSGPTSAQTRARRAVRRR